MSWAPLCDDQPITGEPVTVRGYGSGLVSTGGLIADQVAVLRRLADPGSWQAETADAFRDQATDLADEITKVEGRFREVGGSSPAGLKRSSRLARRPAGCVTRPRRSNRSSREIRRWVPSRWRRMPRPAPPPA